MRHLARLCVVLSGRVGKFTPLGRMFEGLAVVLINKEG